MYALNQVSASLKRRQWAELAPDPKLKKSQSLPLVASVPAMLTKSQAQQKPWLYAILLPVAASYCHPQVG